MEEGRGRPQRKAGLVGLPIWVPVAYPGPPTGAKPRPVENCLDQNGVRGHSGIYRFLAPTVVEVPAVSALETMEICVGFRVGGQNIH